MILLCFSVLKELAKKSVQMEFLISTMASLTPVGHRTVHYEQDKAFYKRSHSTTHVLNIQNIKCHTN